LRRAAAALLALVLAATLWLPNLHRLYAPDLAAYRAAQGIAPRARALANAQIAVWESPRERARALSAMRATNPEWDFMARTFLALALADMALASPDEKERRLATLDAILEDTLTLEASQGQSVFLLSYPHDRPFLDDDGPSLV